jgi:tRNA-modifying protein YgfZ
MSVVIADGTHLDAGVPLHFGNPLGEQRLLLDGAVVDLSNRGVVTVTGPDRLTWLHSLTSQHVERLEPSTPVQALILSPHGHIEHDIHMVDDGTTSWLIVEPGTSPGLAAYLERMRFMLRVEITDVSAEFSVLGSLNALDISEGVASWTASPAVDAYVPQRPAAWTAHEYVIPRPVFVDVLDRFPRAGTWAWEALRIAAGVPRLRRETDHRTIPHEIGLIAPAVHLEKGCYRGQETIARVHNLGRPPRRLVLLHLDGSDDVLPTSGDAVMLLERQIGFIGSAIHHHELGPIALALVKRSVDPQATLTVRASIPGTDQAREHPESSDLETESGAAPFIEVAASQDLIVQP